jgi:cytochrome o ubiquinol oxidase subunit 2
MGKKYKIPAFTVALVGAVLLGILFLRSHNVAVLNPGGVIASKERGLMIVATLLSLFVIIPVYTLTVAIAWKYREGNRKAKYTPDWDRHGGLEFLWWGIPCAIILVLAVITWQSSHALDPYKPLDATAKPLIVEVIAMNWKWLFIYPEQHIASVNLLQFPVNTPISFYVTSDAPMNSFWIPQLGGQIYAMPGMSSQLHLMASKVGSFNGSSANISGKGFAGMTFVAKSTSQSDFDKWIASVKKSPQKLNQATYDEIAKPSEHYPVSYYSTVKDGLYDTVIMKYMMPTSQMSGAQGMKIQ